MSHLLYYPNSPVAAMDVAKSACLDSEQQNNLAEQIAHSNHSQNVHAIQSPHEPMLIPSENPTCSIDSPLLTPEEHKHLGAMSAAIGGIEVMALAELMNQTKILDRVSSAGTFMGGSSAGAVSTSNYVLHSIDKYDDALKQYELLKNHRAAPNTLHLESLKVQTAFNEMNHTLNQKGMNLLHKHAFKTRETRNLNGRIVRESIPVSNNTEVQNLRRFAQKARYAGKGLIVLDAGLRVNSVYHHYQSGKDWKREAVVQSAGFAAGLTVASFVITALTVSTPFGLILLILAGGASAVAIDSFVKKLGGLVYDKLLR